MDLSKIISVTGKPGLFEVISQSARGLVVESLVDGKKQPVHAAERVSTLADISIYTYEDDKLLKELYAEMFTKWEGKEAINHKSSPDELRSALREVLPDFDEDRVYTSDLKKIFQWYNILHAKGLVDDKIETESKDEESEEEK